MKALIVNPSKISTEIQIPSSKSQTHRAILFGSLARQKSIIHHPLNSPDTQAMMDACRLLGATIQAYENHLEIQGIDGKVEGAADVIQAQNSGIILRFLSCIAALGNQPIVITGDHSIRHQRPMGILIDALRQLGVRAESTRGNGFAPVIIQGPLKPGKVVFQDGSDSQNISALLIASVFLKGNMELTVHHPGEKPWVDLTLDWLRRLGVSYKNCHYENYLIEGGGSLNGFDYSVPGDWSSAAFPIAAALITHSQLTLKNLDLNDLQGDKKILEIFTKMGACFSLNETEKSLVVKPNSLQGITIDINDCIDAITILGVVACFAKGQTRLLNAAVARQKECDRVSCLAKELKKMGAVIHETAEGLIIQGGALRGAQVHAHLDHRMAMSLAVAGMAAKGETMISGIDCIKKTYPTFIQDFQKIGAQFEEVG